MSSCNTKGACEHPAGDRDLKACVAGVPLFQGLSPAHLVEIQETAHARHVRRGEFLQRAGEPVRHLHILHRGRARVFTATPDGREQVLRLLQPGDVLGELGLFRQVPSQTSAQALDDVTACELSRDDLEKVIQRHPEIALSLLGVLSRRLEEAEQAVTGLGLLDVEQRLAGYLLDLPASARVAGGLPTVELPASRSQVALLLGTSQETLSRRLTDFQRRGWIWAEGRRTLILTDRQALAEAAGRS
ncbi:MAG: Crp/Fnr family transcriptional regulator [Bacillota bacterium]